MPRIYLDNAATSPCDPRVLQAMLPYFSERFGNPSSKTHPYGWEAEEAVEQAREEVASLLRAEPREILFTSGATEANNLALKGVLRARGPGVHLITTRIEHPSVLDPARSLASEGYSLTLLPCDENGLIAPEVLTGELRENTALVSIMHANNEIGVVQNLSRLSRICAERGILFHTDATQSLGKLPLDVKTLGVDLLSCSAHKLHGPKGTGVLYVRRRPGIKLLPLHEGGGQERGLRSGTLNVPAIVGFGVACRLARATMAEEPAGIASLRDRLEQGVMDRFPFVEIHGAGAPRVPGITNLRVPGLSGEALLLALRSVALASGSACASASLDPSHVLLALGLDEEAARNSLRFSLGRFNTAEEIDIVIQDLSAAIHRLMEKP